MTRKAWIVARHEFTVMVKRVWFIIATFVFPIFLVSIAGTMLWVARHTEEAREQEIAGKPLGVVDFWGGLVKPPARFALRSFASEEEARKALLGDDPAIGAYLVVPADYLAKEAQVRVVTVRKPTILSVARPPLPDGLRAWLVENVLASLDAERVARAQVPLPATFQYLEATGLPSSEDDQAVIKRSGVAYAFFILLFLSIFTASQYLLQGMAEEKENRVMEMVLSSVTPIELMVGKLIGLGAAGLLQMFIWLGMGVAGAISFAVGLVVEPATFFFCFLFFLLGYILYGSLMLGFGALGTNFRESQQMASVWSFIGFSPVLILVPLIEAPQGLLARIFSFVPFTSPTTMIFRYTIDPKGTPVFDVVAAVLLLAGTSWFCLKLSARLYRAGLLLYGKRPGVREIWRWLAASKR